LYWVVLDISVLRRNVARLACGFIQYNSAFRHYDWCLQPPPHFILEKSNTTRCLCSCPRNSAHAVTAWQCPRSQALAYSGCVEKNLHTVQKDTCAAEFEALLRCTKTAAVRMCVEVYIIEKLDACRAGRNWNIGENGGTHTMLWLSSKFVQRLCVCGAAGRHPTCRGLDGFMLLCHHCCFQIRK